MDEQEETLVLDPLYTVDEIAARYKTNVDRVWAWIRNHEMNALQLGKKYLVRKRDIIEFENRNEVIKK